MSIENGWLKLPHSSGVLCGQKRSIFGEGIVFRLCILYNAVLWKYGRLMGRFQSRNRDAFHFKYARACVLCPDTSSVSISESRCFSFQEKPNERPKLYDHRFQSRNRDAFRFKARHDVNCQIGDVNTFQSRNRDAFRFKVG